MTQDSSAVASRTATEFSDALAELKRRGSLLLLAGAAPGSLDDACHRLMGDDSDRRRRFRVTTNRPTGSQPGIDRTVFYETDSRSVAVDSGPTDGPTIGGSSKETVRGDLGDLYTTIETTIEEIDAGAGGLDPAELRICLDSADALVASHDREASFEFFHALSRLLRRTRGMGHVHLPAAFTDESVQVLTPLFDAVIEVRPGGQQRWHLKEQELTTDWLTV